MGCTPILRIESEAGGREAPPSAADRNPPSYPAYHSRVKAHVIGAPVTPTLLENGGLGAGPPRTSDASWIQKPERRIAKDTDGCLGLSV